MNILGISAYNHDAAAALLSDGVVVAAAQEDRFRHRKPIVGFPGRAASFCLDHADIKAHQLDAVVFYDKPNRRFDRLFKTQLAAAPSSLVRFVSASPAWIQEHFLFRLGLRNQIKSLDRGAVPKHLPILFSEHHLSHAASSFYPSPFEEAAILTMDGAGEWPCISLSHGKGEGMSVLLEQSYPHSLGLLYSAFSRFLGFAVNSGEYKLMALSAYGDETSEFFKRYRKLITEHMVHQRDDGSFELESQYFDQRFDAAIFRDQRWEQLFGMRRRREDDPMLRRHASLALALQRVAESIVVRLARQLRKMTGSPNLCLSGGVALNSMINGRLEREGIFENIWLPPAPGDAGGAIGSALAAYHLYFKKKREITSQNQQPMGVWLGPEYGGAEVRKLALQHQAVFEELAPEDLIHRTVQALEKGQIVGWHQGRMEFGPRSLGNRNILADPRNLDIQRRVNLQVKFRESFRPLSPIVLEEDAEKVFERGTPSPYMSFSRTLRDRYRRPLPWNYGSFTIKEKLHTMRSDFPAVTLVDMTARVQTVNPGSNPRLYRLLQAFRDQTGCPLLATTSFNMREKPMVNSPAEAYTTFMQTGLDVLVIGNFYFEKSSQPEWDLLPLYNL